MADPSEEDEQFANVELMTRTAPPATRTTGPAAGPPAHSTFKEVRIRPVQPEAASQLIKEDPSLWIVLSPPATVNVQGKNPTQRSTGKERDATGELLAMTTVSQSYTSIKVAILAQGTAAGAANT